MKQIFLTREGRLRNVLWVVIFLLILSLIVIPLIVAGQTYGFEITFWHQLIVIAVASLICQRLSGNAVTSLFGTANFPREFLSGLCLGSLLMLVPALVLTVFGLVQWDIIKCVSEKLLPAIWSMAGVVLAEELLFRGFIFQRLIAGLGEWPAQIVVALLFLLTHSGTLNFAGSTKIMAMVNIFTASMLFGKAYLKTKSLALPIAIHFSANVMQGSILGFGVSGHDQVSVLQPSLLAGSDFFTGGPFGLEAGFVGLVTLLLMTAAVYTRYDIGLLKNSHTTR